MIIGVTVTDNKRVQVILRDELRVMDGDFTPQDARLIATQILSAAERLGASGVNTARKVNV